MHLQTQVAPTLEILNKGRQAKRGYVDLFFLEWTGFKVGWTSLTKWRHPFSSIVNKGGVGQRNTRETTQTGGLVLPLGAARERWKHHTMVPCKGGGERQHLRPIVRMKMSRLRGNLENDIEHSGF